MENEVQLNFLMRHFALLTLQRFCVVKKKEVCIYTFQLLCSAVCRRALCLFMPFYKDIMCFNSCNVEQNFNSLFFGKCHHMHILSLALWQLGVKTFCSIKGL